MEKLVIQLNHSLNSAKDVVYLTSLAFFFSRLNRCCPVLRIYSIATVDTKCQNQTCKCKKGVF